MVALDSRGTPDLPRGLSSEVTERLRDAIVGRRRDTVGSDARLNEALHAASAEATSRGLRPEELIVLVKQIAIGVYDREHIERPSDVDEHARFMAWLVSASLKAYFGS